MAQDVLNRHESDGRELTRCARLIFEESLEACRVETTAAAQWRLAGEGTAARLTVDGLGEISFEGVERLAVVAVGKAAGPMTAALLRVLPRPPGFSLQGVLVAPAPLQMSPPGMAYFRGGHPLPDEASFRAATAALRLMQELAAENGAGTRCLCFFLISGGASAMMELPLDGAVTLEETRQFHEALVHSGAPIGAMNCVRKHFSAVKGGRLRAAAGTVRTVTLAISDVPGGQLDVLGSGPTVGDRTTLDQCRKVLAQYGLLARFPAAVRAFFL